MKNVTILQVASYAKVGKSTVSKYLNGGHIQKNLKERIDKALNDLDYHPNAIARALRSKKSYIIGVLISYINDIFALNLVSKMEDKLREKGYSIIISSYNGDKDKFKECSRMLIDKMVDGLVIFPTSKLNTSDFSGIIQSETPYILVDRPVDGLSADVVASNNINAGYIGTNYLVKKGHKHILFVTGEESSYTSSLRTNGIKKCLYDNNIDNKDVYFLHCSTKVDISKKIHSILKMDNSPTAIFATSFYYSINVLKALNYLKLSIPQDISLLGFDDISMYNTYPINISSLHQPSDEISNKTVELILMKLNKTSITPSSYLYNVKIIENESIKTL